MIFYFMVKQPVLHHPNYFVLQKGGNLKNFTKNYISCNFNRIIWVFTKKNQRYLLLIVKKWWQYCHFIKYKCVYLSHPTLMLYKFYWKISILYLYLKNVFKHNLTTDGSGAFFFKHYSFFCLLKIKICITYDF